MKDAIKLPFFLETIRKYDFPKKLGILEALYGRRLAKSGLCWVECANGIRWKLDLTDSCHRWIVFGKYEGGAGIDYAASYLKNGGVYVDSGVNIGQWLLYLGSLPNLHCVAFEPVASQREWLQECLSYQNKWKVDIVSSGLGSQDFETEIQINGSRSTLHMDWYVDKALPKTTVAIKRLDRILADKRILHVDFWKLDVEGAELDALKGAQNLLETQSIKCIYFECHPSNYQEICKFLALFNYRVFDLKGSSTELKTDVQIAKSQDLIAKPINQSA